MPGEGPPLPPKFPVLCRAIYSWGGETRRDLGFVEGDLIEALSPGDGAWWMGRLRRNRQVGLFPSNFVEILDEPIPDRPHSRSTSPMPGYGGHHSRSPSPMPNYHRSASPRPGYDQIRGRSPSPNPYGNHRAASPNPNAQYHRAASPNPNGHHYRSHSPAPPQHYRAASPNPQAYRSASPNPQAYRSHSPNPGQYRSASPNPQAYRSASPNPQAYRSHSPNPRYRSPATVGGHANGGSPGQYRAYSPAPPPHQEDPNDAPPPPPVHRYATPQPAQQDSLGVSRGRTPNATPSPRPGNTPSPLRSAMQDVMSSLEHMASPEAEDPRSRTPLNPWSPEAFEEFRTPSRADRAPSRQDPRSASRPDLRSPLNAANIHRAQTSLGFAGEEDVVLRDGYFDDGTVGMTQYAHAQRPRAYSNYVEQMEDRLRRFQLSNHPQDHYQEEQEPPEPRSKSALGGFISSPFRSRRQSQYDLPNGGGLMRDNSLSRATTVKTNSSKSTNATTSTNMTSSSLMSGMSAGGFSATSAGSLARRKKAKTFSMVEEGRGSPFEIRSGTPVYDSGQSTVSHRRSWLGGSSSKLNLQNTEDNSSSIFGGLVAPPKPKKTGFLKKILHSAKASTASARSIATGSPAPPTPKSTPNTPNARPMSLHAGIDWVSVRRDVNRANTLSKNERYERQERQQLMSYPVLRPVDALEEDVDGDEAYDGSIVHNPADIASLNLTLVDKAARFVSNLPPFTTPESLAQQHVCRPYRTDVQRLRAIFTWCAEKLAWENQLETDPLDTRIDTRRVLSNKRGSPEEVATVVQAMCTAMGIPCDIVKGYLKTPGEALDLVGQLPQPNHFWNCVVVDGEWRMMDCSLASSTHPRRGEYTSCKGSEPEFFWFLTRPCEICYTHVPLYTEQQHMVPPLPIALLLALPTTCPNYFKSNLQLINYDTSLVRIEDLEVVQIEISVPADIEIVAEVEVKAFALDQDGDVFETGEVVKKRALAQVGWEDGVKIYRVKAVLPGDEGRGVLRVYAGKKGLMHSIKDNPYPLAFSLPILHSGDNPPYDFLLRHPTPHATRHDLYVTQPQCLKLAVNNTFVFAVRQHPSSPNLPGTEGGSLKPAKLAIQTPSGKILRLLKKAEQGGTPQNAGTACDGVTYETIIKCGERGAWRALVLADRTVRWCVYAEWIVA